MVIAMMGINDSKENLCFAPSSRYSVIRFLQSLRVFKLLKILFLNLKVFINDSGFFKFNAMVQEGLADKQLIVAKYNPEAYLENSSFESDINHIEKGELNLNKLASKMVIDKNINYSQAYSVLGWLYSKSALHKEAEEAFLKAIKISPSLDSAYTGLGSLYLTQSKFAQAEEMLKSAIKINSGSATPYKVLGDIYLVKGDYKKAETVFIKALKLNPNNLDTSDIFLSLGWIYMIQNKMDKAETIFKNFEEIPKYEAAAYGALGVSYLMKGDYKLSRLYFNKQKSASLCAYNPITVNNYHKLNMKLKKKKIKLVCVQYPTLSIVSLKKIFDFNDNVIFVNNERSFKEAIARDGFKDYFTDMFAGSFGHCTLKGNRLLAQNIANVILKDVFNYQVSRSTF